MFDECFVNINADSRSLTNYARNVVTDSYHYDYSGIFYSCQFIKSFRPFHSFWEEGDLSRRSIQAFQNDTIIISWLFSFRVIQPTVQWHTFKTFVCFHQFLVHHKNFFVKYLINRSHMTFSNKIQAKNFHMAWHVILCSIGYVDVPNNRNRTSMLLGELWYTYRSI